jgi:diaminopimelate decarboxylase
MSAFVYTDGQYGAEGVTLADVARTFGTPCYVYSRAAIESHWTALHKAFGKQPHLICYAVKANSNLAILNILAQLGSGFDIVSVGELERVIKAGGDAGKTVFSGVGKREDELEKALRLGIKCFNVESEEELLNLNKIAAGMGVQAPVSLRVNPDVDIETHPYIATGLKENKFGIPHTKVHSLYKQAANLDHIDITGIDCHIGSQLTDLAPFVDALDRIAELIIALENEGIELQHIDVGGGLGIQYQNESLPAPEEYIKTIMERLKDDNRQLIIEPGRCITGAAGVLLTRVEYLKHTEDKNFAIVDAAMNDLLRPALYDAWHDILPVAEHSKVQAEVYDIVGPVCESGDFLGRGRELAIGNGDLLAVCSAGAYGFSMSSNYNSRPRACEVMIDNGTVHEIRRRESIQDLMLGETMLPV